MLLCPKCKEASLRCYEKVTNGFCNIYDPFLSLWLVAYVLFL